MNSLRETLVPSTPSWSKLVAESQAPSHDEGRFPCKVVSFSTAKPGKHGSAKAMIVGKDIFTDKQYEETFGTGDMIPAPVVKKTEYTCIDINEDDFLILMTKDGEMKEDLKVQ